MVTYKEEKHWLTSEEKAREFHKKLIKGEHETLAEDTTPPSVKRKKPKRARHTSPPGGKGDIRTQMECLKIYSNNVNGLNSPSKRKALMSQLIKEKYDIVALQETHILAKHAPHLINKRIGKEFIASDIVKKRGVVIYIKENIPATVQFKDMEGRYIAVLIDMDRQKTLICNIYAPNGPKKHFVNELKKNIMKVNFDHLIILGDFNGVLDVRLDTSNATKNRNYVKSRLIPQNFVKLKEEFDLQDAWRIHNPGVQDYTFFSARHKSWARIDMLWVSNSFCTKIKDIKIHPRDKSDHCPIT
uniref:exodeoxyribonuclease III n=1 Tax=Anolis carolinensis TaxID=28377 RepID=A0A803TU80_ANOCA